MNSKKKYALRYLFWGMTLVLMTVIFVHSSQVAEVSSATSASFTERVLTVVYPPFTEMDKVQQESIINSLQHLVRKSAHFTVYLALGVTSFSAFCTYDLKRKTQIVSAFLVSAIYAASDEVHQLFVEGRAGMISDVLLDSLGAACGILIVWSIISIYIKKHKTEALYE